MFSQAKMEASTWYPNRSALSHSNSGYADSLLQPLISPPRLHFGEDTSLLLTHHPKIIQMDIVPPILRFFLGSIKAWLEWKKRLCHLWMKKHRTWEEYNISRIYREKIRNAKAQLELNLATAVKDKNSFYKYIYNKRSIQNLHLESTTTCGRERYHQGWGKGRDTQCLIYTYL